MPQFDWTTIAILGAVAFMAWTNKDKLLAMLPSGKAAPVTPEAEHTHNVACWTDALRALRRRAVKAKNTEAVKAAELLAAFSIVDDEEPAA